MEKTTQMESEYSNIQYRSGIYWLFGGIFKVYFQIWDKLRDDLDLTVMEGEEEVRCVFGEKGGRWAARQWGQILCC